MSHTQNHEPRALFSPRLIRAALVVYWLALAIATHWPKLEIQSPYPDLQIDKLIHALAFGTLAVLLRAVLAKRLRFGAIAIAVIYCFIDEFTQTYFLRTLDYGDIVAGLFGIAFIAVLPGPRVSEDEVESHHEEGFARHAMLVSAVTFLSRITGLVRDAVIFAFLGLSVTAEAFFIGFLVPNLFRRLFGEGALSAAFIPHYTDLLKQDKQLAKRFAMVCLSGLTMVTVTLTIVGEIVLGIWLVADGLSEKSQLAIQFTMAMLPYMPMVCLVALFGGVMQVHRRFGPPAAAPILMNLTMIGFAVWAVQIGHEQKGIAWMLAFSVLAAGLLQVAWQLSAMLSHAGVSIGFRGTGAAVRSMLVMMLPMVFGLAVFQINTLLDSLIAFTLAAPDALAKLHLFGMTLDYPIYSGAVAALTGGQRLYQFPLGVFGIALATAIFPALAHAAAHQSEHEGHDAFGRTLRQGLRLAMFIGLPASAGLILLREPIVQLFFQRGAFDALATQRTAVMLAGYAAGVWAYSMTHVLTRAFYARKDARTPLRVSLVMVGFNLALNLTLIWPLGEVGLAVASAISGTGQVLLLRFMIARAGVTVVDGAVLKSWLRTAALTALMCAAVWPVSRLAAGSTIQAVGVVALGVAAGGLVIGGGAFLTKAPELRWLTHRRL